jgi:polar amino acid transport system substrate-binding protein
MKLKTLLIAAVAVMGLAGTIQAKEIKVGVAAEPYPPFTVPDSSGHWSGWEIDIMNAICKDQKMDCVITTTAWDGIIPALTGGQIDMIMSSMSITAARSKVIAFSNKYYETPAALATAKDATFGITPDDLAGKIIGVETSSTNSAYARKFFSKESTIKIYPTADEATQDLAAGRVDAVVGDEMALQGFLKTSQGEACCKIRVLPYDKETLGDGIGAGFRKSDTALREQFNKGLADIRANGTYDEISKKYFDFNIYGE